MTTDTSSRTTRSLRGRIRPPLAVAAAAFALVVMAAGTFATHGSSVIDLTADNNIVNHDGAIYGQGGVGAGTGTFDPFLTLKPSPASPVSQAGTEDGYNQCDDPGCPDEGNVAPNYYDQFFGGGRTHELLVSAIPTLEYNDVLYREFSLDANDEGADTWMSIDEIKIFVDTQVGLTGYDNATELFSNDTVVFADKIFDMDATGDDQTILMVSQGLESGSGVSDVTVLVPNSLFPVDCAYGSTSCDLYLYFWTAMGHYVGGDQGVDCGTKQDPEAPCDWNVSAGFEEWRIRFLPVVNIEKDANASFTRDYDWTVDKTVTPETLDLFDGDTADVTWSVTPTRDGGTDSDFLVSGTITITNPTGASPIPTGIDAEILSVEDILTLDSVDIDATSSVDCGVFFPYTLEPGDSLVCTYEVSTPNATSTSTGENTATVTIESGIPAGDGGIEFSDTVSYDGTAAVDFSGATATEVDATATLTDDRGPLDEAAVSGVAVTYEEEFACGADEGTHDNTARVTEDDSGDYAESSATATVNCYQLTVSKTANESLTRTYTWDIVKTVDPSSLDLFNGDSAEVEWTITVTRNEPTDSGFAVAGTITITNPAPMIAEGVAVSDVISHAVDVDIVANVDCDAVTEGNQPTVDVPASDGTDDGEATCAYWADLPNADDRTNTATATLFGEEYSGSADVDFSTASVTEVDATADVDDGDALHEDVSGSDEFSWSETFACSEDEGEQSNTARVTPTDSGDFEESTATVDVNCYELSVSKDANESFDRDYDWDISKTRVIVSGEIDGDLDPATLVLDENQAYDLHYEVLVEVSGYTDDNHAVAGTITITNPAPMIAEDVAVSDVISHAVDLDIAANVDCDAVTEGNQPTVDVPANNGTDDGEATCAYWADLPNADDRTNTATATLFGEEYSGSADVDFGGAEIAEIDECVVVTDNNGTADTTDDVTLGTVCANATTGAFTAPKTFEFTISIDGFAECGPYTFTNVATYVAVDEENDTGETDSATYTVNIEVPCPEGCTLTWGYWKTHNESFWGGAPADPTWELLGDVDLDGTEEFEGEDFFLSGLTYFEVLTTPVAGNQYFNLAHQYIAAQLNFLDGADPSAALAAFNAATILFETYTDEYIGTLKGKVGKELRAQFVSLAGTLASYNEGLIGPGHCDEDATSSAGVVMFPIGLAALLTRRLRRRT